MCGIAGMTSRAQQRPPEPILKSMAHRGPDGSGVFDESPFWRLFHTRLAIVDLTPAGEQPMTNEGGDLVMIFNGEIYNHKGLRSECMGRGHTFSSEMDGEVILHLWEDEGPDCLARLNGIFALAIGRPETGEIWLARDPFGVKPLFYRSDGEEMAFASELAALEELGGPGKGFDEVALAQFLTFLWVPDPRSPMKDVSSLLPGHFLSWAPGATAKIQSYGVPLFPASQPEQLLKDDAVETLSDRVAAAVQSQLMADVPVGLMASGGIDSSLIWAACGDGLQSAYCIEWDEGTGEERLHEDAATVRQLERAFGSDVVYLQGKETSLELMASGDLFADPAVGLAAQIAASARGDGIKVLLSGHGGDEAMGGYRRHAVAHAFLEPQRKAALSSLSRLPFPWMFKGLKAEYLDRVRRAIRNPDPFGSYMELCSYSTAEQRARALDADVRDVSDEVVWARHREVWDSLPPSLSMLRKAMALDTAVYLPGLGLAYMDRAGMSQSVEIRVPWLDLDLFRWSLTLPDSLLVKGLRTKVLSKELAEKTLGAAVARRPKRGFAAPTKAASAAASEGRGFRQETIFTEALSMLEKFRRRAA